MLSPFSNGNGSHENGSNGKSEHVALVEKLLSDERKEEALNWITNAGPDVRTIGGCESNDEAIALVRKLYEMGAAKVWAVHIHSSRRRKLKGKRTGKLVVELPRNRKKRESIFQWCEAQGDALGYTPKPDHGESHLFLLLD